MKGRSNEGRLVWGAHSIQRSPKNPH